MGKRTTYVDGTAQAWMELFGILAVAVPFGVVDVLGLHGRLGL